MPSNFRPSDMPIIVRVARDTFLAIVRRVHIGCTSLKNRHERINAVIGAIVRLLLELYDQCIRRSRKSDIQVSSSNFAMSCDGRLLERPCHDISTQRLAPVVAGRVGLHDAMIDFQAMTALA